MSPKTEKWLSFGEGEINKKHEDNGDKRWTTEKFQNLSMINSCSPLVEILKIHTLNFHLVNSLKWSRRESFKKSEKIIAFMFFIPTILRSICILQAYFSLSFSNKKLKTRLVMYLGSLKLSTVCSYQSILFKQCEYFLNKIDWTIVFIDQKSEEVGGSHKEKKIILLCRSEAAVDRCSLK